VLLYAREQHDRPVLWYERDYEDTGMEERVVWVIPTGMAVDLPRRHRYLGSAHMYDGEFILHVYEIHKDKL